MKLILTREVAGVGSAGDVVTVKDGFARNYLLPRGNAIAWTQGGEKQIEGIRRARSAREIRDLDHAREVKAALEGAPIIVNAKVGPTGSLFGSVTDKDLVVAIKTSVGVDVDRHSLRAPIMKKLGNYSGKINIHSTVVANIAIQVVAAE
jgi:large subunit ribosomal protein L9